MLKFVEPRGYQTIIHTILGEAVKYDYNPKTWRVSTHVFFSEIFLETPACHLCPERLLRNSQLYQKQQVREGRVAVFAHVPEMKRVESWNGYRDKACKQNCIFAGPHKWWHWYVYVYAHISIVCLRIHLHLHIYSHIHTDIFCLCVDSIKKLATFCLQMHIRCIYISTCITTCKCSCICTYIYMHPQNLHDLSNIRLFDVWSHGSWSLFETGSVYLSSVDARVSWKACRTRQVTVSLVPPALLQMRSGARVRMLLGSYHWVVMPSFLLFIWWVRIGITWRETGSIANIMQAECWKETYP